MLESDGQVCKYWSVMHVFTITSSANCSLSGSDR